MGYEHYCQYKRQTSGEPLIPPHLEKEIPRKKIGSGQVWYQPASFLVPFLRLFVYADEQQSDTGYKKKKADEQYYQLVSIHKSNVVCDAGRKAHLPEGYLVIGEITEKLKLGENGLNRKNRAALPVNVRRHVRHSQYAISCSVSVE